MSWLCRDHEILEDDLDTLSFEPRASFAFVTNRMDGVVQSEQECLLESKDEWEHWLNQNPQTSQASLGSSRINLILGARGQGHWKHDPSLVSKLPWSEDVFSQIKNAFFIHGSIVRTINRNVSCMFSRMRYIWRTGQDSRRSFVYSCRSAASWPQDMALSVTFLCDSLTTNAVLFGCDMEETDMYDDEMTIPKLIISRLRNSDIPVHHPMLLPAIFADIERDRQVELVRAMLSRLGQRLYAAAMISNEHPKVVAEIQRNPMEVSSSDFSEKTQMSKQSVMSWRKLISQLTRRLSRSSTGIRDEEACVGPICSPTGLKKEKATAILWLEVSRLRNGLCNWQSQLLKMIDHVDELDATEFTSGTTYSSTTLEQLGEAGARIKERLQEIVGEYDEYIKECTHIMEGMSLATQLELAHISRDDAKTNQDISRVNLDVAQMARRDGNLMKSIAVLGMIFLPASLVTAFFSTGFFDWISDESKGKPTSIIWAYLVSVIALTLMTVGLFCIFIKKRSRKARFGEWWANRSSSW